MSEIDLTLADMEEPGELGLLQIDSESTKVGLVSLKKSISFTEDFGFFVKQNRINYIIHIVEK